MLAFTIAHVTTKLFQHQSRREFEMRRIAGRHPPSRRAAATVRLHSNQPASATVCTVHAAMGQAGMGWGWNRMGGNKKGNCHLRVGRASNLQRGRGQRGRRGQPHDQITPKREERGILTSSVTVKSAAEIPQSIYSTVDRALGTPAFPAGNGGFSSSPLVRVRFGS